MGAARPHWCSQRASVSASASQSLLETMPPSSASFRSACSAVVAHTGSATATNTPQRATSSPRSPTPWSSRGSARRRSRAPASRASTRWSSGLSTRSNGTVRLVIRGARLIHYRRDRPVEAHVLGTLLRRPAPWLSIAIARLESANTWRPPAGARIIGRLEIARIRRPVRTDQWTARY